MGGFKDPAQATIEKLMRTRHVARIARLGDGAYGGKRRTPIRVFKPPPVADLVSWERAMQLRIRMAGPLPGFAPPTALSQCAQRDRPWTNATATRKTSA